MRSRPIEDFWISTDGDDWSPAFRRAQRGIPANGAMKILLGPRTYRCATAIKIWRRLSIEGVNNVGHQSTAYLSTGETEECSRLWFSSGSHGLIIMVKQQDGGGAYSNNFDTHTPTATDPACTDLALFGSALASTAGDARAPTFRNFILEGAGSQTGGSYHGIIPLRNFTMEGITLTAWSGHGMYMAVSSVDGTTPTSTASLNTLVSFAGNANYFTIKDCVATDCGKQGFFFRGADTNAGTFEHCLVTTCGKAAFTSIFEDTATVYNSVYISSATATAGPGIQVTMSSSSHGVAVDDWVLCKNFTQSGTTYTMKGFAPTKVSAVAGAVITTTTTSDWPTSGALVPGPSTGRFIKLKAAVPSTFTFNSSGAVIDFGAAHSFVVNDLLICRGISSSANDEAYSSEYYFKPFFVSAVTANTITVVYSTPGYNSNWPSSGTATLDSNALVFGFECFVAQMSFLLNNQIGNQFNEPQLCGMQLYYASDKGVILNEYHEGDTQPNSLDGTGVVIGSNFGSYESARSAKAGIPVLRGYSEGVLQLQRGLTVHSDYVDFGVVTSVGGLTKSALRMDHYNTSSGALPYPLQVDFENSSAFRIGGAFQWTNTTGTNNATLLSMNHSGNNRIKDVVSFHRLTQFASHNTASTSVTGQSSPMRNPTNFAYYGYRTIGTTPCWLYGDGIQGGITAIEDNAGYARYVQRGATTLTVGNRVLTEGIGVAAFNTYATVTAYSGGKFTTTTASTGYASYTTYTAQVDAVSENTEKGTTTLTVSGGTGTAPAANSRLTIPTSTAVDGYDIHVVAYNSSTSIEILGTGFTITIGGNCTATNGWWSRLRAVGYNTAVPTTGEWAIGDIVWNTAPTVSGVTHWVCTAAGTPGTWVIGGTQASAFTYDSNCTIGQLHTIYKEIASGGSTGTADDVTIVDATTLPYAIRIVDIQLAISTADGTGSSTATLRTASGGGGSALSEAFAIDSTGVKRKSSASVLSTTAATTDGLYLRRSSRDCVGEITITYIINE